MIVSTVVPEPDACFNLIPLTGYAMLESFVVVWLVNVAWSVQLPEEAT